MLRGSPYRCREARLPVLPAPDSLGVTASAQLGAETPFLQHLLQPFQVFSNREMEKMTETMSFLPKREQKVFVILLANNVIDMGEGLVSSLFRASWCVTSAQLRALGLQCVQSLPLTCPPSVPIQKVRNSLLPHLFFISFCCFSCVVSLAPSFCCPALQASLLTVSTMTST